MAAPVLTIRGREISEPTLWAVGGVAAFFTPLPAIVGVPIVMLFDMSESPLLPAALILAGLGFLTSWAVSRPSGVSARVWSAGVWLAAWIATFLLGSELLMRLNGVPPFTGWLWSVVSVVGIVSFFALSPVYAWAAFVLGQRFFSRTAGDAPGQAPQPS